jgi:bacillithiol system protein YtxJ
MTMITIDTEQELGALVEESNERPVLIFKHSNACGISSHARDEIRRLVESRPSGTFGFGMVVVQQARSLSDEIEARFGIRHETPQAIVMRGGKAVWNASHSQVTYDRVAAALEGS